LFGCRNSGFVLPTTHVERVARVSRQEIKTVENRGNHRTARKSGFAGSAGKWFSTFPGKPRRKNPRKKFPSWIIGIAEKRIAFAVDQILNEQEVLVKGLGRPLSRVRNVAGATVLGGGQVVPILSIADLMKSAGKGAATHARAREGCRRRRRGPSRSWSRKIRAPHGHSEERPGVAGYDVKTAVDGAEAFTVLRTAD